MSDISHNQSPGNHVSVGDSVGLDSISVHPGEELCRRDGMVVLQMHLEQHVVVADV